MLQGVPIAPRSAAAGAVHSANLTSRRPPARGIGTSSASISCHLDAGAYPSAWGCSPLFACAPTPCGPHRSGHTPPQLAEGALRRCKQPSSALVEARPHRFETAANRCFTDHASPKSGNPGLPPIPAAPYQNRFTCFAPSHKYYRAMTVMIQRSPENSARHGKDGEHYGNTPL